MMKYSGRTGAWIVSGIFFAFMMHAMFFRRDVITLDPYDPHPICIRKTWWGLKSHEVRLCWMQPPGYDYEAWCAKSPRGDWYQFVVEWDGPEPEQPSY